MRVTPQTQLCISLASRPGSFGIRFHNYLYAELGVDFLYKSCTTNDLEAAIEGVRALGIRGCGLSMPFKIEALKCLDEVDASARRIGAVNTILNTSGVLKGFNTDYVAVKEALAALAVPASCSVAVLGGGGMARAIIGALQDSGFQSITIVSRNLTSGRELAEVLHCGLMDLESASRSQFDFLINATPIGMGEQLVSVENLPFSRELISRASFILDSVVAFGSSETPFTQLARGFDKQVILGKELTVIQAREQFEIYTGVRPSLELLLAATEYAFGQ